MKQQLNLKQSQTLAPVLYQAMSLLNLGLLDLNEKIEKQIEDNPALEYKDNYFYKNSSDILLEENVLDSLSFYKKSLSEHLLEQLSWLNVDEKVYKKAFLIIQNLDERGFFKVPLSQLKLKEQSSSTQQALTLVQNLDPIGCGCEDSLASLAVQIAYDGLFDSYSVATLKQAFVLFSKQKQAELEQLLDLDSSLVSDFFDYLKSLELYPGLAYAKGFDKIVSPELELEYKNGSFKLSFINNLENVLEINPFFEELSSSGDKQTSQYAKKMLSEARQFIYLLNQRQQTIFSVAYAIIRHQSSFLRGESSYPLPLTLKQIADETKLHEATISRTVNSKYMQFNHKIIALKSLFGSSISNNAGQMVSKDEVKDKIKELIEANSNKISDQKISDILGKMGYKVARRTVAKYRGQIS